MSEDKPTSLQTIAELKQQAEIVIDQGNLEEALYLLDQAEQLAQSMDDPSVMGLVWQGRTNVWLRNNQFEASFVASQKAAQIYEECGNQLDMAIAKITQVFILATWGRFDEAIALADELRPYLRNSPFGQAVLAANLGPVYSRTWQFEKAIETFAQAWRLYEELKMPVRAARALHNMGVAARRMDDLDLAFDCFMRAYPQYVASNNIFSMVKTQFNLAMLRIRQDQLQEAMIHLAQARADLTRLPDSPDMAYIALYEARVRRALNQPEEAERLLRQALVLLTQQNWHVDVAETLIELGHLLVERETVEKQSEGLACLEQAAARLENLNLPLLVASVKSNQAEILIRLNRKGEAGVQAQQAYEMFMAAGLHIRAAQSQITLADSCWHYQPNKARTYYQTALETVGELIPLMAARCWRGLGRLASTAGDSDTAEHAYGQAIGVLNSVRRSLASHRNQASFLEDKQAIMTELLAALHESPDATEKVLLWVERFKAGALADLLVRQPLDPHLDQTLQALIVEREKVSTILDKHWSALMVPGNNNIPELPQQRSALVWHDKHQVETLMSLRYRLQAIDEQITQYQNDVYAWRDGATVDSHTIHTLLDEQTVLISYYVAGTEFYALTVTNQPGDIHIHQLPTATTTIAHQWQQTRRRIMRPSSSQQDIQRRLSQLWQALIAPLVHRLTGKKHLLILPHRQLFHIPFASLYDPLQQQYLIERWSCQLAPSATILSYCQQRPLSTKPPLLLGYPGEPGQQNFLAAVSTEINILAKLWPQATILQDQAATVTALMAAASGRSIIHLAGHIYYDATNPLSSGMPLADSRWLRASDLYLHYGRLTGATVVLSGCESARVQLAGGDILGLTSAFLYAGAKGVIAGLWSVDDAATAILMTNLYEAIQAGKNAVTALQFAQRSLLRTQEYNHPYYWAAFHFNGSASTDSHGGG